MTRPRNLNNILDKLTDVKQSGDNWTAACPLPGHKTPAGHLTLKDAGDKALVTCQGGKHSYQNICVILGYDSLAYSSNGNGHEPTIVEAYDYTDASGKLLYQVVRYVPKDFKQRQPDDSGGWIWSLKGIKPVLYHLPEVLKAVAAGEPIYITEGEKDADNLVKLGLTATTNSGGAGKWKPEYSETLPSATEIILRDKDAAGEQHAAKVAASLHSKAKSIRIVELPDRDGYPVKDVSDWLAAGGTRAELETLVSTTPEYKPIKKIATGFHLTKLSDLYAEPDEAIDYLWENTLIKGGLSLLVAKPKVGKSTLAQNLALALAKGESSFLGRNITASGSVVYLAFEEKRGEVKRHFKKMGADENLPIFVHVGIAPDKAIDELRKAVIDKEALLAIVDPLQRLVRVPDLNDYSSVSLALEPLMQIARDTGCHILMIHHANKGIAREGGDSILGSTAIFGSVDCALFMKRTESCRTIESFQRYGEDLPRTALVFDVATGLTSSGGSLESVQIAECGKAILELIADNAITEKEVKDGITDHKGGVVSKGLRLLYEEGKIQRKGLGKKGDPFLYNISPEIAPKNAGDSRDKYIEIPTIPTIQTVNSEVDFSFENDTNVGDRNLDDATNSAPKPIPSISTPENVLGIPIKEALEIWRAAGSPAFPLAKGETCLNLEKLLNNHPKPAHFEAVKTWLRKQNNGELTATQL